MTGIASAGPISLNGPIAWGEQRPAGQTVRSLQVSAADIGDLQPIAPIHVLIYGFQTA